MAHDSIYEAATREALEQGASIYVPEEYRDIGRQILHADRSKQPPEIKSFEINNLVFHHFRTAHALRRFASHLRNREPAISSVLLMEAEEQEASGLQKLLQYNGVDPELFDYTEYRKFKRTQNNACYQFLDTHENGIAYLQKVCEKPYHRWIEEEYKFIRGPQAQPPTHTDRVASARANLSPISKALKKRMEQLDLTTKALANLSQVSVSNVHGLLYIREGTRLQQDNAKHQRQEYLHKAITALNNNPNNPDDKPFPDGTVEQLTQWYGQQEVGSSPSIGR